MVLISVMTPALNCKSSDSNFIQELCVQSFGGEIELFQLVPITKNTEIKDHEIVVRLNQSEFSINSIEQMLKQHDNLNIQLEKSREALKIYQQELDSYQHITELDKNKKINQLDEENKKLKQLLKQQLENSENLRVETQATIETLREEFNMLVKELINFKGAGFKHEPLKSEREEREKREVKQHPQKTTGVRVTKLNMAAINT